MLIGGQLAFRGAKQARIAGDGGGDCGEGDRLLEDEGNIFKRCFNHDHIPIMAIVVKHRGYPARQDGLNGKAEDLRPAAFGKEGDIQPVMTIIQTRGWGDERLGDEFLQIGECKSLYGRAERKYRCGREGGQGSGGDGWRLV